ncbi:hypothetical protein HQ520_13600 [bacterium]|nr:hypothetical protein [bacterium]
MNGSERWSFFRGLLSGRGCGRRALSLFLAQAVLTAAILATSCATIEKDKRHLTRVVEEFVPESMPMMLLTAPVWGVAGLATIIVDGLILNPVFMAPQALDDALTWSFLGFGVILPLEVILILPRLVAVPVIFLGSEILRVSVPYLF